MGQQLKATQTKNIWQRIFSKPFRTFMLEGKIPMLPAFEIGGKRYFMFESQEQAPTGRQLAALAIYNEMEMRVSRQYLIDHCRAVELILSNKTKINLTAIGQLNVNLKERTELMPLPEFVWKLASVVFIGEDENPYDYNFEFNENKIKFWKGAGMNLDFFLQTPLMVLVPSLREQLISSPTYLGVAEAVAKIHQDHLTDILLDEI